MAPMFFVLDENVAHDAVELLCGRGHRVELVADWLGQGTADELVAFAADREKAIVVTHDKDFKHLIRREESTSKRKAQRRFKSVGRISLQCPEARARRRLAESIELIEYVHSRLPFKQDQRLIMSISSTTVLIHG